MTKSKMTQDEANLSASIMLAIEIDSAFKLYSFRIISPEQYTSRTKDLIGNFRYSTCPDRTKSKKEQLNNQQIIINTADLIVI